MLLLFAISSLVLYLASAVSSLGMVLFKRPVLFRVGETLGQIAFLFHTLSLALLSKETMFLKFDSSGDYYFTAAWMLVLVYIILTGKVRSAVFGSLISAFAALFLGNSSYLIHVTHTVISDPTPTLTPLLLIHVVPALIAEVSLVFIFVLSAVFIFQEQKIKQKSPDLALVGTSNLKSVNTLNQRFSIIGFVAMTLAVLSGSIWSISENQSLINNNLSTWFALVSWCVLAFLLHARTTLAWAPRKLSFASMITTAICLVSFLLASLFTGNMLHGSLKL